MGDVVMITGASKRLGKAVATALVQSGWAVIIHTQVADAALRTYVSSLESMGGQCAIVEGDLSDPAAIAPLFERALSLFGRIDHLINNASLFAPLSVEETTIEAFEALMTLHNTAPFFLSKALFLHLVKRGATGSVINIGDATVASPKASRPAYYTAKGALMAQSRALAVALAPTVRVNVISPGPILSTDADQEYFERMEQRLPLKKTGEPREVIEAVRYLLGATFVTGSELVVDGGLQLL